MTYQEKVIRDVHREPNVVNTIRYFCLDRELTKEQVEKLIYENFPNLPKDYVIDGKTISSHIHEAIR